MSEMKYKIIRGSNYTEGFADAFHITVDLQKDYFDFYLEEDTYLDAKEGVVSQGDDGNRTVELKYDNSEYAHLRVIHGRYKIPKKSLKALIDVLQSISEEK